jgi:folate-binding protein YgfZ
LLENSTQLERFGVTSIDGDPGDPAGRNAGCWHSIRPRRRPTGSNWRRPQNRSVLAAWHWLEIAAGQPRVVAATQEAFVPQMLNMELPAVGGVSFSKGCYPGQEIVARTQYLGKVKRRTYRARLASAAARHPCLCARNRRPALRCHRQPGALPGRRLRMPGLRPDRRGRSRRGSCRRTDRRSLEFLPLPYEIN